MSGSGKASSLRASLSERLVALADMRSGSGFMGEYETVACESHRTTGLARIVRLGLWLREQFDRRRAAGKRRRAQGPAWQRRQASLDLDWQRRVGFLGPGGDPLVPAGHQELHVCL